MDQPAIIRLSEVGHLLGTNPNPHPNCNPNPNPNPNHPNPNQAGHLLGTLPNTAPFVVPHGLSIDHYDRLWATDVATHRVYRLDATTGAVLLTLGRGSAG